MGATKRDVSGVFDAELRGRGAQRAVVFDQAFHLTHKGITFRTETFWPEWTEVGVEMCLPDKGAGKDRQILCRGVVVQCARSERGTGFEVALVFLDLPKRAHTQLSVLPPAAKPLSISISR